MIKILLTVFLVCNSLIIAPAHPRTSTIASKQKHKHVCARRGIRLSKEHPTVYISFDSFKKLKPLYMTESGNYVLLRLHNNTRWSLLLESSGRADGYGDAGLYYSAEKVPESPHVFTEDTEDLRPPSLPFPPQSSKEEIVNPKQEESKDCDVTFQQRCHVCSTRYLPPGRSLSFSVPREYLCKNTFIYVTFQYQWEKEVNEPEHIVSFFGSNLLKENR